MSASWTYLNCPSLQKLEVRCKHTGVFKELVCAPTSLDLSLYVRGSSVIRWQMLFLRTGVSARDDLLRYERADGK